MASLALHQARSIFPALRIPRLPSLVLPAALAAPASSPPFQWAIPIPSLQSILDLFPRILLAVPKKKVSHSRKSMRSSGKGLKDKHNIVNCPACGMPKLAHHLCAHCFSGIMREKKVLIQKQRPVPMRSRDYEEVEAEIKEQRKEVKTELKLKTRKLPERVEAPPE